MRSYTSTSAFVITVHLLFTASFHQTPNPPFSPVPAEFNASTNVGYMGNNLRYGSKMIAPMFINVGGTDSIKISDISVTGYTPYADYENGTGGEVVIQVLNSSGAVGVDEEGKKMEYFFYDNEDTDPNEGGPGKGWYRNMEVSEDNKVTEIPFDPGQGMWVTGVTGYNLKITPPTLD